MISSNVNDVCNCTRICLVACMQGIWAGMIGGTCMQTAILVWVTLRTDWNKEVEIAKTCRVKINDNRLARS
jgi:hypothetical protein